MIISADLLSVGSDDNTNLFLTQRLYDYDNNMAFHCRRIRKRKLINSKWAYVGKVFTKVQERGDKEETKRLSLVISTFPNNAFSFNH